MGIVALAVSCCKHSHARVLRRGALARAAAVARAGSLVRIRFMGPASRAGGIRGVDHRDEEHPILPFLPAGHLLLCELAKSSSHFAGFKTINRLLARAVLRGLRHSQQSIHRHAACGIGVMRVVAGRTLELANDLESNPFVRDFRRGQRLDHLGATISFRRARRGMDANHR